MSGRWQHKVVELKPKMFGGKTTERAQAELDKLGAQGWELVAVAQQGHSAMDSFRMFFKKEA